MSHQVTKLALHLENDQSVVYTEGNEKCAVTRLQGSTLLAYFKLNEQNQFCDAFFKGMTSVYARDLFYHQIPEYFRYVDATKTFVPRKMRPPKPVVGRMITISPIQSELYHLRLLLLYVKGAESFRDMMTVEGVTLASFKAAAAARGLLEDSEMWEKSWKKPSRYRCHHRSDSCSQCCVFTAISLILCLSSKSSKNS